MPPPSSVPASVGSPVNLLNPDRYEFYTFDESGELVKRLMTLEEIQAIVAAGEEGNSMVTFANDDQPTVAFNFSQPPSTKVHSVVTNVQNVLKAQMEAHKNKPLVPPTLDTPDVSDSWSLILPSIFGNTGVDIVPDKSSGYFTTPDTETFEIDDKNEIEDFSLSKEGNQQITNTTNTKQEVKNVSTEKSVSNISELKNEFSTISEISSTSITKSSTPTTILLSSLSTTEIPKISSMSTMTTLSSTTVTPRTTTTMKPSPTTTSTTSTTTTSTTVKPTTIKVSPSTTLETTTTTTLKPELSTENQVSNIESSTIFEKISTFIPFSTVKYVTERATYQPSTTIVPIVTTEMLIATTKTHNTQNSANVIPALPSVSSTTKEPELDKINATTITTQSISPSTTVSSTEVVAAGNIDLFDNFMENKPVVDDDTGIKSYEPLIPIFDVAQSISQIASDLGGDFQPLPTVTNVLDTTQVLGVNFESKENIEMDVSTAEKVDVKSEMKNESKNEDNFVKISTLDPHPEQKEEEKLHIKDIIKVNKIKPTSEQPIEIETTTLFMESTTIDTILNESMDDLLSQVVNEVPHFVDSETMNDITTTEHFTESITEGKLNAETTSETYKENYTTSSFTTEKIPEEPYTTYTTTISNETSTEETLIQNSKEENFITKENDLDDNGLKEYIQISVSDNKSELETTTGIFELNEFGTDIPIDDQENENDVVKNNINNNEIFNLETTTIQLELTTETTTFGNINEVSKLAIENINSVKETITNKKEANLNKEAIIANITPKIDEFKKKIQKVDIAEEELADIPNNSWKLISTVSQSKNHGVLKDKVKGENHYIPDHTGDKDILLEFSKENQGLEVTTKDLSDDVEQFTELCNELAFRYWNVITENIDKKRSFVLSPYSITSMLAMMFMGAKGATSGEMNEILKLDEMVTFNPHFTLKNISDSIEMNKDSGIAVSAFIRELYSDRNKGKILTFYKERAQHFYNGHVEEINFKLISDIIRRRTNLLVKRYTWGKISEYMKTNTIVMQPPLAAFSANIFQVCSHPYMLMNFFHT